MLARCLACLLLSATVYALEPVHHDLRVRVSPPDHSIEYTDRVTLPAGASREFELHAGLQVEGARALEGEREAASGVKVRRYVLGESGELTVSGKIHHPLVDEGEEYARSFSRTPGLIDERGVFLTGATYWVPHFEDRYLTFRMEVRLPEGWRSVSQGRREKGWVCPHPMEEIYLIAGRYEEYARSAGGVTALAFLAKPDPGLASRYLETTAQYIEMYRRLIGPYPFSKFALVENFWETGYGMPSFTLLGPTVIRLPFILHSSYPHEILHNWWGNSVYVDWETGNWCEGLTAYLADHLIKEGQGRGVEYRRDTLKKYRSYVREGKDFPLSGFRSRHSGATEAVGYGKSAMLFHMLRMRLGDDLFGKGLQLFYRRFRFKEASFSDLSKVFSEVSEKDLGWFFEQWVERTGAPELAMTVEYGARRVSVSLEQKQKEAPYRLTIPVAVTMEGVPEAAVFKLELEERDGLFVLGLPANAVRVDIDPQFDLFRRLEREEIPPTLGDLFGSGQATLVLPSEGAEAWRKLADAWKKEGVEVVAEGDLKELPGKGAVWILGSANRWRSELAEPLGRFADAGAAGDELRFVKERVPRAKHSFVYVVRRRDDPDLAIGWVGAEVPAALPGLARKLPHYGKYSYLAFEGDEPTNVVKGVWPAVGSRLIHATKAGTARGSLGKRKPLARLAPVFDPARLMEHVRTLASDRMRGRGNGSPELDQAASYIAAAFGEAGLRPGGDDGSWYQTWTEPDGPDGKAVTLKNVVGVIPGTKPEWKEQSVVLGAHYDHLGLGWPDVREAFRGQIHNGADDNASGVAVMIELARLLAKELKPPRTVVFVAFSGEEWNLKGSRHYVKTMRPWAAKEAIAMVNLDTVGRLEGKKLLVLGSATAREWPHIAMGVGYTTGVEAVCAADDYGGSDQRSFHEAGVPAVQIFTGATEDYHRPSDDVEKVDADGLVKVATFVRETIVYLSGRETPLTSSLKGSKPPPPGGGARRVSLGTVPAFDFPGPGVKVASLVEGSPAQKAGIRAGDILLAVDGEELKSLRSLSEVLKRRKPGDGIRIRLRRGDEELELEATLVAR